MTKTIEKKWEMVNIDKNCLKKLRNGKYWQKLLEKKLRTGKYWQKLLKKNWEMVNIDKKLLKKKKVRNGKYFQIN